MFVLLENKASNGRILFYVFADRIINLFSSQLTKFECAGQTFKLNSLGNEEVCVKRFHERKGILYIN